MQLNLKIFGIKLCYSKHGPQTNSIAVESQAPPTLTESESAPWQDLQMAHKQNVREVQT